MKKIISKLKRQAPDLSLPELKFPEVRIPGISSALELGENLFSSVTDTLDKGVGLLQSTLGGVPFFGRTAQSASYDHNLYDERHYFLVPDPQDPEAFSLCITRCLPENVPPVNDLPKRRLLHLPSEHALPMLEEIVIREAADAVREEGAEPGVLLKNLGALLDEIDKVDDKAFQGLLLIGGLVALVHPLAGAAVAAKAAVPAIAMVMSKNRLKVATETTNNMEIARKIKLAEKNVKRQFGEAGTAMLINPFLANLGHSVSVETWLMEEQKFEFQCREFEFSRADIVRLMDLSCAAIRDTGNGPISEEYFKTMRKMVLWSDP